MMDFESAGEFRVARKRKELIPTFKSGKRRRSKIETQQDASKDEKPVAFFFLTTFIVLPSFLGNRSF